VAFSVYILVCADGTYFSGVAKNLAERIRFHELGLNVRTSLRLPIQLVYQKSFTTIRTAIEYEKLIQTFAPTQIKALIDGTFSPVFESNFESTSASEKGVGKVVILPATYLGNWAYFNQVVAAEKLILDTHERYEKQTYRSRCAILSANGNQQLVVPVIRPNGKASLMHEIEISYVENWQKDHLKALESAYRKSPFYAYFAEDLFSILRKKHVRLIDLNLELTTFILRALGSSCTVELGNETHESSIDHKKLVHPKTQPEIDQKLYQQVFANTHFEANMSCVDFLFNLGNWG